MPRPESTGIVRLSSILKADTSSDNAPIRPANMAKIRITESQAKKLKLLENDEDSGFKSIKTVLGQVLTTIVISGDFIKDNPANQNAVIQTIKLNTKYSEVKDFKYHELTGKMTGIIEDRIFEKVKKEVEAKYPSIEVSKKKYDWWM